MCVRSNAHIPVTFSRSQEGLSVQRTQKLGERILIVRSNGHDCSFERTHPCDTFGSDQGVKFCYVASPFWTDFEFVQNALPAWLNSLLFWTWFYLSSTRFVPMVYLWRIPLTEGFSILILDVFQWPSSCSSFLVHVLYSSCLVCLETSQVLLCLRIVPALSCTFLM